MRQQWPPYACCTHPGLPHSALPHAWGSAPQYARGFPPVVPVAIVSALQTASSSVHNPPESPQRLHVQSKSSRLSSGPLAPSHQLAPQRSPHHGKREHALRNQRLLRLQWLWRSPNQAEEVVQEDNCGPWIESGGVRFGAGGPVRECMSRVRSLIWYAQPRSSTRS